MFAGAAGNPQALPFRSAEWRTHGASTITGCCFPDAGSGMSSTNSTQVHRVFPDDDRELGVLGQAERHLAGS